MTAARGPWEEARIRAFLDGAVIPLRLSATAPSGWPVVLSLWFVREGDRPPYRGVRGRERASIDAADGGRALELLLHRYRGGTDGSLARWLLSRVETEVAIVIEPVSLATRDFTARIGAG